MWRALVQRWRNFWRRCWSTRSRLRELEERVHLLEMELTRLQQKPPRKFTAWKPTPRQEVLIEQRQDPQWMRER